MSDSNNNLYYPLRYLSSFLRFFIAMRLIILTLSFVQNLSKFYIEKGYSSNAQVSSFFYKFVTLDNEFFHNVNFIVSFVVLFVFFRFIYLSYRNLILFNENTRKHSPIMAVLWFFIPIANFFMPLKVVLEIWDKSKPVQLEFYENKLLYKRETIIIWWFFYILTGIFAQIMLQIEYFNPEIPKILLSQFAMSNAVSDIISMIFLINIVGLIAWFQDLSINNDKK